MVTKAIVRSINRAGNRCVVRMPLFETASSSTPVEAEALVSITPGFFNNIFVGDIVFVAFEENALEKPTILGKLYTGTKSENETPGGAGILDTLTVRTSANVPAATTTFVFKGKNKDDYVNLNTPKNMADYILWLETLAKKLIKQLDEHFRCFKNWTQWQLKPENVEVDDGDIDSSTYVDVESQKYQKENDTCKICEGSCTKNTTRKYSSLATDTKYPNL